MANKQLTASVRLNTTQFEQKLRTIARSIDALNNAVGKQGNAYQQVNAALGKEEAIVKRVKKKTDETNNSTKKWVKTLNAATNKLSKCKSLVGSVASRMGGLTGKLLGGLSVGVAINGADNLTGAQNRFNNIASQQLGNSAYTRGSDGNVTGYSEKALNFTKDTMDKIYSSAQKVRTEYSDMLSNVSKTMTLAPDAFQGNIDNAIRFQEIMAEAYAVGGASAAEMSTSMYQLTQALGAGTLAGDELRSVREGAPLAYQKIEEFAQGVLNTSESLKDLAADGKITSEMVVAAVMNMGDEMDQAFALTKFRFTDVWNQIKSAAQKSFSPVVEMMTDKLNEAVNNGLIQKLEKVFMSVAKAVMIVYKVISNVVNYVVDNWGWIKQVVISALIAIIAYETMLLACRIAYGIISLKIWIAENQAAFQLMLSIITIIAIIAILVITVYLLWQTWSDFANGAITLGEAIIRTLLIIAIVCLLIGIIIGNIPLIIIAIVAAILALIVAFFGEVCYGAAWLAAVIVDILSGIWNVIVWLIQAIVSGIVWLGVTILNIVIGVINAIIQFLWAQFVEPWIGIIEWVLNAMNGGFDSFGDAVKNLLGQIISWFLSLGKVVTKIIDAIFGTDWTSGLNALQDSVLSWGKNEDAITISRDAPEIKRIDAGDVTSSVWHSMDSWHTGFINPGDWGSAAYDWGSDLMNFQLDSSGDNTSLLDKLSNSLGLGDLIGETSLDPNTSEELLKGISDDTDSISDSMDLTREDLEYLRRVADMEWKKEFTTASITVDMSNYNTINGDGDLDGLVTRLADKLYDEMNAVANGVYT